MDFDLLHVGREQHAVVAPGEPAAAKPESTIVTVKVVVTVVMGSLLLAAWAWMVTLPPRWGGSAELVGRRVVKRELPSAGNSPTR